MCIRDRFILIVHRRSATWHVWGCCGAVRTCMVRDVCVSTHRGRPDWVYGWGEVGLCVLIFPVHYIITSNYRNIITLYHHRAYHIYTSPLRRISLSSDHILTSYAHSHNISSSHHHLFRIIFAYSHIITASSHHVITSSSSHHIILTLLSLPLLLPLIISSHQTIVT